MSDIRWYFDKVKLRLKEADDAFGAAAGFQVEGAAKQRIQANGQIDTGFMLNSVYTVTRRSSGYSSAASSARSRNGTGQIGGPVDMDPDESVVAIIVVGALYGIYQELRKSFLYAGAEAVASQLGGTVEKIYRGFLND